jgi:hypothetical protein
MSPAFICVVSSLVRLLVYRVSGTSIDKCVAYFKTLRSQGNDYTPVTPLSSSTSVLPKKIVSPERASVMPVVFDSDKYEAVSIQLETLRLNGVRKTDFINSPLDTVSEDVALLQTTMPHLNPRLINYVAKLVNIKEHFPPE